MLEVRTPNAKVTTTTELRTKLREAFDEAQETVVYVVSHGRKLGAVIGLEHLRLLEEAMEREADMRAAAIAGERLRRAQDDSSELLDEDEFWRRVEARSSRTGKRA